MAASMLVLPTLSWVSSPNYSSRNGSRVRLIVVHDCEGNYAGSVSWFAMARSHVSAHIVLSEDGARATQMVAWGNKAWHACAFNPFSEGIEAAGFSAKGLGEPEWVALAAIVAFRLKANSIPCQRATAANDWAGYCQHVDLGAAGGGHHDITTDEVVRAHFFALVSAAYAQDMPAAWSWGGNSLIHADAPAGWQPHGSLRDDLAPPSIEWVQARLNALLGVQPHLTVDGLDGPSTRSAVRVFQRRAKIHVDGEIGPQTIAAIQKATPAG